MKPDAIRWYVRALGDEWTFPELRLARDFARQLRNRGHVVEIGVRYRSARGRMREEAGA